jgi:hypothetical protein
MDDHLTIVELTTILGNVGEFLSSIGVIATLIYLAIQIRESKKATESSIIWERAKALRETALLWVSSPETSQLMREFGMIPNKEEFDAKFDADPARGFQYLSVNRTVAHTLEASLLTAGSEREIDDIRARLRQMLLTIPGILWTWPRLNTPGNFNQSFAKFYDDEVSKVQEENCLT